MHIENVEFSNLSVEKGMCFGVVTLLTRAGATHCACQIAASAGQSLGALQGALLHDALRQLKRMPEFRRNAAKITLSPLLKETGLPLAA